MTRRIVRPEVLGAAALLALWGAAFSLACVLVPGHAAAEPGGPESMAGRIMGSSRALLGGALIGQADRAFHRGVSPYEARAFSTPFDRLARSIAPAGHVHLHEAEVHEIVPWLYLAARIDPHRVEAYVLAAYWLAGEGGRPDLADRVLDEARRNHPGDYRVYQERGRLAVKTGRLDDAMRAFETALRAFARPSDADPVQARIDRATMLTWLGLLAEDRGDAGRASACYRAVLEAFPGRAGLRERIAQLARGGRAHPPPAVLWEAMLYPKEHVCGRVHGPEQDGQ